MAKIETDLNKLDPRYRDRFVGYIQALEKKFPQFDRIVVTETLRSEVRQKELLAKKGAPTKVKRSNHQDGWAMDWVPVRNGKADYRSPVFRNIYRALDPRDYGLTSGAHLWNWDEGHLQIVEVQGPGNDLSPEMEVYEDGGVPELAIAHATVEPEPEPPVQPKPWEGIGVTKGGILPLPSEGRHVEVYQSPPKTSWAQVVVETIRRIFGGRSN